MDRRQDELDLDNGPLAVVLSGGGARAAYQVGVLNAIAEKTDPGFEFPIVTGVSAGSINAASLAAHPGAFRESAARLEKAWLALTVPDVFDSGMLSLVRGGVKIAAAAGGIGNAPGLRLNGILDTRPLRRTLQRAINPNVIDRKLANGRLQALGLSATNYENGRTVTFVHAPPDVDPWRRVGRIAVRTRITAEHVMASSALPIVFPAVRIDDGWYGDGSLRQMAPLAPAVHLGARRILAISLLHGGGKRSPFRPEHPPPAHVFGTILNAVFLDAMELDAERLLRVNRSLALLPAGERHPEGLHPITLHVMRPSQALGGLARDLRHCLPKTLRFLLRGLGSNALESPDLLSYLLFERPYIERLIELGREDARSSWPALEPLLQMPQPASMAADVSS
jgi:NTE family protein